MALNVQIMGRGPLGLAREGYPFILLSFLVSGLCFWLYWPLGVFFAVVGIFCVYFFRDPMRPIPGDPQLLVSPADGKVLKVEELPESSYYEEPHQKISIFMSGFDVHVNRVPCDGEVKEIRYHPGKFFVASLDKASRHNERNAVIMENNQKKRIVFTQIAGLVARRIVCYLRENIPVNRGERYGLIRFGSRMEVSLPKDWPILVKPGDRVHAAKTALARMKG